MKKKVFYWSPHINEQIATESLFRKKSISDWWVSQKFNSGKRETTKNLYKYIQHP